MSTATTTSEIPLVESDDLYRVFDHTDAPLGPDGTPYAYYEALRDEAKRTPIGWSEAHGGFWVVASYEFCDSIIQDPVSFSNAAVTFPAYATGQESALKIAGQDEPSHRRDRAFVVKPFSPRQVHKYEQLVASMTGKLIDGFIESGRADLGQALGEEIPARLTALLLGLPEEEGDTYRRWCWAMSHLHATDPAAAAGVVGEMHEYFGAVIEDRKRNPGEDVLSLVTHAEIDGERLTDDDLLGFCIVLLIGGIDNSTKSLNAAFWRMGWDPELRRRLIANPRLIDTATDEILRYYTPGSIGRLVKEDITLGGVTMRKDDIALLALPIANRDDRQFPYADTFVADRTPNRHLGLGGGIHRCLGTHLLRVEARAALGEFLRRVPDYELDSTGRATWVPGQVGGMANVPVVFPAGKVEGGTA
ncbi:MAG TPA: cytochrome P450 [Pseudonocardia sp.]|nr:cytochrome P450 [Pseudonocardia sp.]